MLQCLLPTSSDDGRRGGYPRDSIRVAHYQGARPQTGAARGIHTRVPGRAALGVNTRRDERECRIRQSAFLLLAEPFRLPS